MKYPGKNDPDLIMKLDKRMTDKFTDFIHHVFFPIADVGEINAKKIYLAKKFNCTIYELNCEDFNFPEFSGKYQTIFCFEILEHLQNPLLFMQELTKCLEDDGDLFLSMPGRIRFMWSKTHFFEMPEKHFSKWILNPLDLKIVRSKKIRIKSKITFRSFIGIRPIIRLFLIPFNYTTIYQIQKV